jgi:hypothetical protein
MEPEATLDRCNEAYQLDSHRNGRSEQPVFAECHWKNVS